MDYIDSNLIKTLELAYAEAVKKGVSAFGVMSAMVYFAVDKADGDDVSRVQILRSLNEAMSMLLKRSDF